MRHITVLLPAPILVLVGLTGCGLDTVDIERSRVERGSEALEPGSCEDACGGQASDGTCWCDSQCATFGDCCADKEAQCEPGAPPVSTCVGSCGGAAAVGNCWCDDGCAAFGDCCEDKESVCDAPVCPDVCAAVCDGLPEPTVPAGCPTPMCVCDPCALVDCEAGSHCELQDVVCVTEPCDPVPTCVPDTDPCAELECEPGYHCELQEIQCITFPCDPLAACVPDSCPDANDPSVHYISNSNDDPTVCWAILFHCEDTQQQFTNECGCGCIDQTPAGNSCQDQCNGPSSDGTCYCDAQCVGYGDCCSDVDTWCADREVSSGHCVRSTFDTCTTDADCTAGGCGGELCHNPDGGGGISTCDCSTPLGPSGCGCVNGQCAWFE